MEYSGAITFPGDSNNCYDPSVAGSGQPLSTSDRLETQRPAPMLLSFGEFAKRRNRKRRHKNKK